MASAVTSSTTLQLRPVGGPHGEVWTAELADGLVSVYGPDGHLVLMLPSEEATKHVRFQRDLIHGRTIRVMVLEGLKALTFKASKEDTQALLHWLPQRDRAEREQEVRMYGVALILLGAAHLLFQDLLEWRWGLAFVGVGAAAVVWPRWKVYALNGVMLGCAGLALLFVAAPVTAAQQLRLMYTALGSLLLLWAIQQFSLLSAHHRLRTLYDAHRASLSTGERHHSRLVQVVAVCAILFAVVFGCYAGGLYWAARTGGAALGDLVIFGGLSVLMVFSGVVLFLRRYPPYLEAKITAQMLIVVAVLYAWGLAAGFAQGMPFAFSRGILAAGLLTFEQPYVWAPLIVLVLLFDRWFVTAVEREVHREI
ncbi:MAG: hypothetical protein HYV26_04040 [Candidatus Hydrogenedentes bacterium]|nr:hypothetical protein [Candidatus Hydrogenedentota bacterium]